MGLFPLVFILALIPAAGIQFFTLALFWSLEETELPLT
jgi:hypothetical protein